MDIKAFAGELVVKSETRGEIECIFASLNCIDADSDVTLPGAFKEGQECLISGYGHSVWNGSLPCGKGRIHTTGDTAVFTGAYFMHIPEAAAQFATVKAVGPAQRFSYGFTVLDSEPGTWEGRRVKFLKALDVHEISPVLRPAGVGTRLIDAKTGRPGPGVEDLIAAQEIGRRHYERLNGIRLEMQFVREGMRTA
jgi:hypothetical protein